MAWILHLKESKSARALRPGHWAVVFFVIAVIAAVVGFGGIAVEAAGIAKILFFFFLILFIVSLLVGRSWRRPIV